MIDFAKKLYAELQIKFDADDPGKMAPGQRLPYVQEAINQFRKKLQHYEFPTETEEIQFFKSELPLFLSEYIYYSEIETITFSQRIGTQKSRVEFLESQLARLDHYFRSNTEFFDYYRYNRITHDRFYFVRANSFSQEYSEFPAFMIDCSFCTVHCWKLASFIAFSRLEEEIRRLYFPEDRMSSPAFNGTIKNISWPANLERLVWTDPKNGLTELIYGLDEKKCFNYGKVDLTTIRRNFEICFSVDLGNTSSTYQKLISRKKGTDTYLTMLCEKYNQRIERIEEQELRGRMKF